MSATAKRLLASRRHFSAYVYVSGTVIGVIEAQLAQQLITLANSAHGASARTVALADSVAPFANPALTLARPMGTRAAGIQPARKAATVAAKLLAATPYMGWDTYFAVGGKYSEATILTQASELISLGLRGRGYRYVWLDVGWWHGTREADGQITVSPAQWPHGLAWLVRTLHAAGLLVGLYTDAGPNGCGGAGQGSYGHYQQDVNTFAAWGFDSVKVDFCGGAEYGLNPATAYTAFHTAIEANSSHRPMLLSICNFLQPEQYSETQPQLDESAFTSYSFGPSVGNSWRTDTDVGFPGNVPFLDVLRNMDADAASPQAAGPGHWNDPDYLAPDQGMSATQFRTQLSMWAMLAAPLMISDNLTKIGSSSLAAVQDTEVIAIDQDPGGVQGTLLSTSGNGQVWVKPLIGGALAVALLNRGSGATKIETSVTAIGLPPNPSYELRNLWTHTTSSTSGSIGAEVPGDSTVLLRVSAA
jgi:alpha-galactosidase